MANKRIRKKQAKRWLEYVKQQQKLKPTTSQGGMKIVEAKTDNKELVDSAQRNCEYISKFLELDDNTINLIANEKDLQRLASGGVYVKIQTMLGKYKERDVKSEYHFRAIFSKRLKHVKTVNELINSIIHFLNSAKLYKPKREKLPKEEWGRYIQWVYYEDFDLKI